jgi:hypothetical protein
LSASDGRISGHEIAFPSMAACLPASFLLSSFYFFEQLVVLGGSFLAIFFLVFCFPGLP